jgi:hypothetical protein
MNELKRPLPEYDVNSSEKPIDLISNAQDRVVSFAKAFADTVYYAQQMQPEELDSPTAHISSSNSSSSSNGVVMDDEMKGIGGGGGVAKILKLGIDLSNEFEQMVTSIQQVPDYAAAYSNDEAYEKRLLEITKDERDGPREILKKGIEAGRQRLRNIDAVLCAAAKYALQEPLCGVAGVDNVFDNDDDDEDNEKDNYTVQMEDEHVTLNKTSHFDKIQVVGPDFDKLFIR